MDVQKRLNPNLTNLWVDGVVLAGLLASFAPNLTGLQVHEWLSLAFGGTLIIHVLLHWNWLAGITRHFFRQAKWSARLNYLLNFLLFVAFTVVVFSGVMESRFVLQTFGLTSSNEGFWRVLHSLSTDLTLWIASLHIAVHWRWIWKWIRKAFRFPRHISGVNRQFNPAVQPVKIDDR